MKSKNLKKQKRLSDKWATDERLTKAGFSPLRVVKDLKTKDKKGAKNNG